MTQTQASQTNQYDQYEKIANLEKSAHGKVFTSSGLLLFCAAGAFFVLSPVGLVPAVAVAGALLLRAGRQANQQGRNAAYIRDTGIFAHVLAESELIALTRLRGRDEVLTEVKTALHDGQQLSAAAEEYLELCGESTEPLNLKTLLQSPTATTTIEVSAKPVEDAPVGKALVNVLTMTRSALQSAFGEPRCYDVRSIAASEYVESILWIGPSRSGKTTAADQLGRKYREKYGDRLTVFYVTPVLRTDGDEDESLLFDWCDRLLKFPLLNETDSHTITLAYEQFEALLDDFLALPSSRKNPKLFIADELTLHHAAANGNKLISGNEKAQRFFGKLTNAINANASGGKAAGIGVWGLSPMGAVGEMGLSKASMSACTSVFVANLSAWNGGVYNQAKANNLAPSKPPSDELESYCSRHNIARVVSVACGDWQPLADYEIPRPKQGSQTVQDGSKPEPLNRPSEPLNQTIDEGSDCLDDGSRFTVRDSSERFTPLKLTLNQVHELVQALNQTLNQTQIIEQLWQVKKGGSDAWKQAHSEYKQVTGE